MDTYRGFSNSPTGTAFFAKTGTGSAILRCLYPVFARDGKTGTGTAKKRRCQSLFFGIADGHVRKTHFIMPLFAEPALGDPGKWISCAGTQCSIYGEAAMSSVLIRVEKNSFSLSLIAV